jgi:hypothetical protein
MGHDGGALVGLALILIAAVDAVWRRPGDFLWLFIVGPMLGYVAVELVRAALRQRKRRQGTSAAAVPTSYVRPRTLVALVSLACACGVMSALMNAGVCFSKFRFLTDLDYFKGAIAVVITDPVDGVTEETNGRSISKLVHSQKYASVDEFLKEFPDCCTFVPANAGDGGDDVTGLDLLFGYRTVRVSYVKRYRGDDGTERSSRVMGQIAVSNCGVGRPFR